MDEYNKAFFRRSETIAAIDEIRRCGPITIYVGAGVSIDRSGVTWSLLIEELLKPHVPESKERQKFVKDQGPLFAASAAHQLYTEASPAIAKDQDARQRMVDVIRPLIYSPGIWRAGELAPAIADFVYQWNMRDDARRSPAAACLVTTNYDDYLVEALKEAHLGAQEMMPSLKQRKTESPDQPPSPVVAFPTVEDPLQAENPSMNSWVEEEELPRRDQVACVYLHGYLPRDLASAESRYPVISESDYFKTQPSSEKALESLFSRSHVLIVGSSITDPPLIRALERTTTKEYSRWALLDGKLDGKTIASGEQQRRLMTSRLAPLKVTPVFADFHVQQAQFFRELIAANTLSDRVKSYKGDRHGKYYYSRMGNWWKALRLGSSEARTEDMQWGVHVYLSEFILPEIRDELGAHHERMKLEMWIRWDPTRDRTFRLLGSTVGVWLDHEAMRFEEIGQARKSVIIDAFREGRPTLKTGGKAYGGRWQSVLAVPVWSEQSGSPFVTAVMVLASQEPEEETALNESRNRAALAETARILQGVGIYITAPDSWWPPQ